MTNLEDVYQKINGQKNYMKEYDKLLNKLSNYKKMMKRKLANLRKYSFCKSHSYSYAQLVYKLAFCKVYYPKMFWKATLRNVKSSYRKWVHIFEAFSAGISFSYIQSRGDNKSVYLFENRNKDFNDLDILGQIKKYGYWDMSRIHVFPSHTFMKKMKYSDLEVG